MAAKEGVPSADILHAVMSQKGGIEATFKDGFGKDAIKGRVNTAVKAYKTERRIAAQNNLKEASEFIQKRLGEAKVPKSREERNENIRFNMKANDVPDEVIKEAFSRARARTNSEDVTAREVANHAKMILREKTKIGEAKRPENNPEHIEHSRKALKEHIKSLDVDPITKNKLNRVISNFTTSKTGKRGALSAEESADAIAAIHHEIETRHKEAQELIKKYPKGSEASKRAFEKAQKIEEAIKQSKQTVGALKDGLEQARQTQEKVEQQAAQEAQQAKLDASHIRDQEQRIDRAV
ncbi:UNVERIFIED_CONTAM: hypothetical protein RF648_19310, partial [Kocuria sp. CPCC 205274]